MTIEQVRAARAEAERRIGEILARLGQDTGLMPLEVRVRTVEHEEVSGSSPRVVLAEASIRLEAP